MCFFSPPDERKGAEYGGVIITYFIPVPEAMLFLLVLFTGAATQLYLSISIVTQSCQQKYCELHQLVLRLFVPSTYRCYQSDLSAPRPTTAQITNNNRILTSSSKLPQCSLSLRRSTTVVSFATQFLHGFRVFLYCKIFKQLYA